MVTLKRIPPQITQFHFAVCRMLNTDEQKRDCGRTGNPLQAELARRRIFDQKISNEEMSERWERFWRCI